MTKKKKTASADLNKYMKSENDSLGKSIRQPKNVWKRLDLLKKQAGAKTLTQLIRAVFEKACDEAGIAK